MTNPNPAYRRNIKPGLTVPAGLDPELDKFLQSVKEHLQGGDGTRGQPLDRFVTLEDLRKIGLITTGVKNGRGVITGLLALTEGEDSSSTAVYDRLRDLRDVETTSATHLDGIRFDGSVDKWVSTNKVAMLDRDPQTFEGVQVFEQTISVASNVIFTNVGTTVGNVGIATAADDIATGSLLGDLVLNSINGRVALLFPGSATEYIFAETVATFTQSSVLIASFASAEIELNTTLLDINATVDVSGIATFNSRVDAIGGVRATATVPFFELLETDAAADNQKWFVYAQAGVLALSAATDLEAHTNFLRVLRTDATVIEVELNATLLDFNATNFELAASTIALTDPSVPFLPMNTTTPALVAGGAAANSAFWMIQRYNNAVGGPDLGFYHSRGATVGAHTILGNADEIGSLSFYASDGTSTPVKVARIIGLINGTVGGATDLPSRIAIYATPDGSATLQQVASFSPDTTTIAATTLTLSAAVVVDVVGSASSGLFMSSSVPVLGWYETDAGSDEKRWLMYCNAGGFSFETRTDDGSSSVSIFSVSRSGTTVSNATFPNRVIFSDATGNGKPAIDIASTNPTLHWRETDAAADNGIWYANVRAEALQLGVVNDANSAANNWGRVERTGVSIDSVTLYTGATIDALKVDTSATAGNTRLLVYDVDNAALERVTVGAADSGGAGYKVLRIPN